MDFMEFDELLNRLREIPQFGDDIANGLDDMDRRIRNWDTSLLDRVEEMDAELADKIGERLAKVNEELKKSLEELKAAGKKSHTEIYAEIIRHGLELKEQILLAIENKLSNKLDRTELSEKIRQWMDENEVWQNVIKELELLEADLLSQFEEILEEWFKPWREAVREIEKKTNRAFQLGIGAGVISLIALLVAVF